MPQVHPELAYYPLAYVSIWAAAINSALMSGDFFAAFVILSQHKKRMWQARVARRESEKAAALATEMGTRVKHRWPLFLALLGNLTR